MLTRTSLPAQATEFAGIISSGCFTSAVGETMTQDDGVDALVSTLTALREASGTLYIIGNGGSAAVASHAVTDFFNVGGLRALTLHEPATLTCFSNDYGYEHAFAKRVERLVGKADALIAISSSGQSENILNAAKVAKAHEAQLITLSGFRQDNPLRQLGDHNYWLESDDYGMVEIGHLFLLHFVADLLGLNWSEERDH